jgi:hypothetical protein
MFIGEEIDRYDAHRFLHLEKIRSACWRNQSHVRVLVRGRTSGSDVCAETQVCKRWSWGNLQLAVGEVQPLTRREFVD